MTLITFVDLENERKYMKMILQLINMFLYYGCDVSLLTSSSISSSCSSSTPSSSSSSSSNTTTDSSTSFSSSRSSSSSAKSSTSISGTKKYCIGFGHISSFITSATLSNDGSSLLQNQEKNVLFSSGLLRSH